ncbi:MAG: radical SAM protein [Candidatus Brocadiaceae bacterium]|nr:radical SAM protein [Candidatus Brocadiaceae bacterium]
MTTKTDMPETPVIRPPSEWRSLLVRLTRGCKWNRCRFCGIYPHLGEPDFSLRSVAEIKHDIDLLKQYRPEAETVFFGDADPLQIGVDAFVEIAGYLRQVFPVSRLTCYARASTLWKLRRDAIKALARAGLDRVHIGLESGDPKILSYQRKGQSPEMIRETAAWLKEAGIEISFYVLLGLGGRDHWRNHILETAKLINETEPAFVRLRRLWLYGSDTPYAGPESPLLCEIRAGRFRPQTPEGTVLELKLLIEKLDNLSTFVVCDHENNYVHVSGSMKKDKDAMLSKIEAFLTLPEREREAHYRLIGSRI